jgi:predicted AAA+ superfamily ATPase
MNKLPIPQPDRRLSQNQSNIHNQNLSINILNQSNQNNQNNQNNQIIYNSYRLNYKNNINNNSITTNQEKEEYEHQNSLSILKIKQIEDMRSNILNYKILNEKKMFLTSNTINSNLSNCNIILFGPSGSGKSSFIKTLYRAIYGTNFLPPEAISKLIIKETDENEGTIFFTRLHLKESNDNSSGILLCDTRGHILMNESEKEQFKITIQGNVKDNVQIKQIKDRNPILFWEFWKKDSELFPKEIFYAEKVGIESIPHSIILVFDGSKDEIIDKDDLEFYRDLINHSEKKGYNSINIILTRIDVFERNLKIDNKDCTRNEINGIINKHKDQKIAEIIDLLNVKRSNVHFIENYHNNDEDNEIEIDYQALKTLGDIMNNSEQFIINFLNKNYVCFAKCF